MALFSKKRAAPIAVASLVTVALFLGAVTWILLTSPGGGGIRSAMFFSDGTVTDISIEKHHVDILINRSDIYDSESIVTFDLSNHAEELDDLSLGEMVTVHHWFDSGDGKAVDARSVEPLEPNTGGDAS